MKLDDLGLYWSRRGAPALRALGHGLLRAAPWMMKGLSVAGTLAMFLVGGSILAHGIAPLAHAIEALAASAGHGWAWLASTGAHMAVGLAAGALVLGAVQLAKLMRRRSPT